MEKIFDFKTLTKNEKLTVVILVGWTLLHLAFIISSEPSYESKDHFYPFTESSLKYAYNTPEFLTYTIIPWVMFFLYRFMNLQDDKK